MNATIATETAIRGSLHPVVGASGQERLNALAAADPLHVPGKIIRRIIVIDNESAVRECIIRDWDSLREARRKLRRVLSVT